MKTKFARRSILALTAAVLLGSMAGVPTIAIGELTEGGTNLVAA